MSIEDVKTIISDISTIHLIHGNPNYAKRLYEAYKYLKSNNINSLKDFKSSDNLKIGAFTYEEITIFDRIKDEEYAAIISSGFGQIKSHIDAYKDNPNIGDLLASWGTLGSTPYREELFNKGYILNR